MLRKIALLAAVTSLAAIGTVTFLQAQDYKTANGELGIKAKRPVFGGACKACPWGAMAEVVKSAMKPYGYDVQICYNCSTIEAPRIVAGKKLPPPYRPGRNPDYPAYLYEPTPNAVPDFGATSTLNVWYAYQGTHAYVAEGPRKNLRLIANIQAPAYYIVGVKAELGITDLGQLKAKKWPVRMLSDGSEQTKTVLAYYGLSDEAIKAAGGNVANGQATAERGNFDIVLHNGSMGNAPEYNVWTEVSQRYNMSYLELPGELLDKLAKEGEWERGTLPIRMYRGVDRPIPTITRTGIAIYGRDDMPDTFAYTVAKAVDEQQDLFQWTHLNFYYNYRNVWKGYGLRLHPGAARYYKERGYMKTAKAN